MRLDGWDFNDLRFQDLSPGLSRLFFYWSDDMHRDALERPARRFLIVDAGRQVEGSNRRQNAATIIRL
jgi:hypothetical protein